jgi:hypothetical protein
LAGRRRLKGVLASADAAGELAIVIIRDPRRFQQRRAEGATRWSLLFRGPDRELDMHDGLLTEGA